MSRHAAGPLAIAVATIALGAPLVLSGQLPPAAPAQLVRGPYLQIGTPTSIVVRWRTDASTGSVVRFGSSPGALTESAESLASVTEHEVRLDGLAPATTYYYAVGHDATTLAGADASYRFTTSPLAGTPQPTRIWAFGDGGQAGPILDGVRDAFLAETGERGAEVWLLMGDNAYTIADDADYQAGLFDVHGAILRRTVLWPAFGNHEGFSANSLTEKGAYYDIFTLPEQGEAGGEPSATEAYYSFDYANIHFICLNSHDVPRGTGGSPSAMADWLRADLARNTQQWTIAFFHHPPYSKGSHDSDNANGTDTPDSALAIKEMRELIVPILEQGGVDLVLVGHSHVYERSYLIDGHYGLSGTFDDSMKVDGGDGKVEGDGPYRKPDGRAPHAGAVYLQSATASDPREITVRHPAMLVFDDQPGSLLLDVAGPRLEARFLLSDEGETLDSFTMVKGNVNFPPEARDDAATAGPASAIEIAVLANDRDVDGDRLSITSVSAPGHGTAEDNGDGTVAYTSAAGFAGDDSFTYTIADGVSGTDTATVSVTVAAAHLEARDDSASTERDQAVRIEVLANDFDADGSALTVSGVGTAMRGTVTTDGTAVTYSPNPGFTGRDVFGYTASDGTHQDTAQVAVMVLCPRPAGGTFSDDLEPGAEPGWVAFAQENENPLSPAWSVTPDPAAHSLVNSWYTDSAAAQTKQDSLTAPAVDLSASSRLLFWHRYGMEQDFDGGVLEISTDGGVHWTDLGPQILSGGYTGTLDPSNPSLGGRPAWTGSSADDGTRMVEVEADLGAYAGEDRLVRWRLGTDFITLAGAVGWFLDDVTFTNLLGEAVSCNQAPQAAHDQATTPRETPVTVDVLANDSDPNNDPLTVTAVGAAAHGSAELLGDGTVRYTPAADFAGADEFSYTISDGQGGQATASVAVTVTDSACAQLLFNDGFESGDLSRWSGIAADAGDLAATAGAALAGAFGMAAHVDDAAPLWVEDTTPAGESSYCASFLFDPNDFELKGNRRQVIFRGLDATGGMLFELALGHHRRLRLVAATDSGTARSGEPSIGDRPTRLSVLWRRGSAGAGSATLYIDGGKAAELALDNDGLGGLEAVRLGAPVPASGTTGTTFFDAFVSGRVVGSP